MIYVVRHGQTDMNMEKRLQGRNGLPLNEYGIEQAHSIRAKLQDIQFDFAYSSPQSRAIDTAKIITGIHVITDPRLDVFI